MNTNQTEQTPSAPAEKSAKFETVAAVRTFRAPSDYGNNYGFTIKAEAYQLGNNQHPHFAVTGEIYHKATRTRTGTGTGIRACGCLHDEAAKAWPSIRPIIALHLSNADDGEPGYAEANGYYWLAGAVGGLGQQYTGATGSGGKTPDECLSILSRQLRITLDEAIRISNTVSDAYSKAFNEYETPATGPTLNRLAPFRDEARKVGMVAAKNVFHDYVNNQRPRWQAEADAGIALIRKLANNRKARPMTTQTEIRESFWQAFPQFAPERRSRKRQNDYRTDIRIAFCDYVESLANCGEISGALASRVTL